jgi:hypothetical protein
MVYGSLLKRRLNFKAPGFQERFRNVLGVAVAASPFPKTGGADVLIWGELEFLDDLLKRSNSGYDRADRLGLAPIWITTTLCHRFFSLFGKVIAKPSFPAIPPQDLTPSTFAITGRSGGVGRATLLETDGHAGKLRISYFKDFFSKNQ